MIDDPTRIITGSLEYGYQGVNAAHMVDLRFRIEGYHRTGFLLLDLVNDFGVDFRTGIKAGSGQ
jgi:hypothetical protein